MKRSLHILGEPGDDVAAEPAVVVVAGRVVSIEDPHDGARARRFAEHLVQAGGAWTGRDDGSAPDYQIAIRSTPKSPDARLRAEVLEESADLVLGSARPVFAQRFVEALTTR